MIAASVGNLSVGVHFLLNTTGFTLERDLMHVVNVGSPSVGALILFSTRNLMVEQNLLNKKNVGKPSSTVHIFPVI